jgi:hypothetical protein
LWQQSYLAQVDELVVDLQYRGKIHGPAAGIEGGPSERRLGTAVFDHFAPFRRASLTRSIVLPNQELNGSVMICSKTTVISRLRPLGDAGSDCC